MSARATKGDDPMRLLRVAAGLSLVATSLMVVGGSGASAQSDVDIYVDCESTTPGAGTGTSADPYKSIADAVQSANYPPIYPKWLLFKRGSECLNDAPLVIDTSAMRIGGYGPGDERPRIAMDQLAMEASGERAIVTVQAAQNVEIHELELQVWGTWKQAEMPQFSGQPCAGVAGQDWVHEGTLSGIYIDRSSSLVLVKGTDISGAYAGIELDGYESHILDNTIHGNRMMYLGPGPDDDAGAFGVLIHGNGNLIEGNRFAGHTACSDDYGLDGAAIELYEAGDQSGANNTYAAAFNEMIGNWSDHTLVDGEDTDDHHFIEMGSLWEEAGFMTNNAVEANTYLNSQAPIMHWWDGELHEVASIFVLTRGEDVPRGWIDWTNVTGNTARLTGGGSVGLSCAGDCSVAFEAGYVASNSICAAKYAYQVGGQAPISDPCP